MHFGIFQSLDFLRVYVHMEIFSSRKISPCHTENLWMNSFPCHGENSGINPFSCHVGINPSRH